MSEFKFNLKKLSKTELAFLVEGRCKHGHTWLEHPMCYVAEQPKGDPSKRHLGFFDIETTHLKANFGYVISYRIWDADEKKMYGRNLTNGEIRSYKFDKLLMKELVEDLKKFTHVVVYWGKDRRHDLPFVRTRSIKAGVSFPRYGELGVIDMWDMAKNKLSLHRCSLQVVCTELGIKSKGHPLMGEPWLRAQVGDKEALEYVGIHNEEDVLCMPPVLDILEPFYRALKNSV